MEYTHSRDCCRAFYRLRHLKTEESEEICMPHETVLGLELGSTRIKAVAIDEGHNPVSSGDYTWKSDYVDGIWTYDLGEVWKGLKAAVSGLSHRENIAAMGSGRGAKLTRPRPGHAEFAGMLKYGFDDARNILERSSARETAARVAVGAVCRAFLETFGITVGGYVAGIGGHAAKMEGLSFDERLRRARLSETQCPDPEAADCQGDESGGGRRAA